MTVSRCKVIWYVSFLLKLLYRNVNWSRKSKHEMALTSLNDALNQSTFPPIKSRSNLPIQDQLDRLTRRWRRRVESSRVESSRTEPIPVRVHGRGTDSFIYEDICRPTSPALFKWPVKTAEHQRSLSQFHDFPLCSSHTRAGRTVRDSSHFTAKRQRIHNFARDGRTIHRTQEDRKQIACWDWLSFDVWRSTVTPCNQWFVGASFGGQIDTVMKLNWWGDSCSHGRPHGVRPRR